MLAAVLGPLALGALLVPLRSSFATTAAALAFVAVIVAVAVAGNRISGVVATISSALWFDFFLTEPYERLTISHRPDIETTVALLVVGIVVTELAARSRHHRHVADEESAFVSMIHEMTELAAGPVADSVVVDQATGAITELLHLRSCRFERSAPHRPFARIEGDGRIVHAGLSWPVESAGIPGPEAEILAQWRGRVLGRFALTPTPGVARAAARSGGSGVVGHRRRSGAERGSAGWVKSCTTASGAAKLKALSATSDGVMGCRIQRTGASS
jgi:Domain of unknown function (DUF4118)